MQNDEFSEKIKGKATKLFQSVENKGNLILFSLSKVWLLFK